jgi:hypothetical protein
MRTRKFESYFGRSDPSVVHRRGVQINDVKSYKMILIHCSDDIRRARLFQRGQHELPTDQMMEWARYLIGETSKAGGEIIHNDSLSIAETAAALVAIIDGHERAPHGTG